MTQKDYILIAAELNAALNLAKSEHAEAVRQAERTIEGLATVLYRDNNKFDRRKFFKACGYFPVIG